MKKSINKEKGTTWFLRFALIVMALIGLVICIFAIPSIGQGVVLEFDLVHYAQYIVMVGLYAAAICFYLVLWQSWKLLNYIDKNNAFSELSVASLKKIKYTAITMSALLIIFLEPVAFLVAEADDAPGVIIFVMAFCCAPLVIGVFAAVLQRLLRNAIDMKAENELTV